MERGEPLRELLDRLGDRRELRAPKHLQCVLSTLARDADRGPVVQAVLLGARLYEMPLGVAHQNEPADRDVPRALEHGRHRERLATLQARELTRRALRLALRDE